MASVTLTRTRFVQGVWEGLLSGGAGGGRQPNLTVTHQDRTLPGLEVTLREAGHWQVRLPVPADLISDGVTTLLFRDSDSGEVLDSFTILAGDALTGDIRAEIDLLREELDMLKRAFRRHCLETA